jgi:methionyl aminopeptidase
MEDSIEKWKKAGKITKEALEYAKSIVKPGAKCLEITRKIENFIISKGAKPAFPVNISINNVAAHYTPSYNDNKVVEKNDVIKIDVGACVDGYIGDAAITINLSNDHEKLLLATNEALENAISVIREGVEIRKIEEEIQNTIEKYGFKPISNLGGHEIKKYILHTGLFISNSKTNNTQKLKEGMIIAIEPFATDGVGYVRESDEVQIFSLINPNKNTRIGREVLNYIKNNYGPLPFAERWIIKKFGVFKARSSLYDMLKNEIIGEYPVLVEKPGSFVSQFEKTVLVTKDGCEILTDWKIS